MTNFDVAVGAATLRLIVVQVSQNVSGNTSTDEWTLHLICGNGASWNANPVGWSVTINGAVYSGSYTFDFRGGSDKLIASGSTAIAHNSDGTKTIAVQGHTENTGASAIGGPATVNGTFPQTTIPRASKATVSPNPVNAGDTLSIAGHRASTSFLHTYSYNFLGATGTIATGVNDTTWVPPLSLLTKIPSTTQGNCTLTTVTKSGSTVIGTTTTIFGIKADTDIVPTVTGITLSEATAGVAAAVGGYVQNVSKLNFAITGAAGIYGSTITAYKLEVGGVVVATSASGVTPVITVSGTVAVKATVTDSRGRTASVTVNITVLAYTAPKINSITFKRALSGGTLDDNGTFMRVDLNASVQSLIVGGTQKNQLTHKTSSRLRGGSTWTVKETTPTGTITYNSFYVVTGPYAITSAWEFLAEISDIFSTSSASATVPVAAIFMHWDANLGVGIGKYRENGMLDVAGAIWATQVRVPTTTDVTPTSTGHAIQAGPDTGLNIAIDGNEIMARNNGATSVLALNNDGGDVGIGGHLLSEFVAYAMAAGTVSFAHGASAVTVTGVTVTLPSGRFSVAPLPFVNTYNGAGGTQKDIPRAYASTTTSLTVGVWAGDNAIPIGAHTDNLSWFAVQMTPTTAAG